MVHNSSNKQPYTDTKAGVKQMTCTKNCHNKTRLY